MRLIASESPSLRRRRRRRRTSGAVVGKRCITLVSLEMEGCGDGRRRCSAAEASTAPTPRRSSPTAAPRRAIRPLLNAAAAAAAAAAPFLDRKSSLEPLGVFLSQSVCLSLSPSLSLCHDVLTTRTLLLLLLKMMMIMMMSAMHTSNVRHLPPMRTSAPHSLAYL